MESVREPGDQLSYHRLRSGDAGISADCTQICLCQNQSLAPRQGCLAVSCPNIGPLYCDTGAPSIPWILQLMFAEHLLTVQQ